MTRAAPQIIWDDTMLRQVPRPKPINTAIELEQKLIRERNAA
jgi:hypothetical protein